VRVLALDYGVARTGVAVTDETGTIATPLTVVLRVGSQKGLTELVRVIADQHPDLIVVGLPAPLGGGENAQLRSVRSFVSALRGVTDIPVEGYDERFTTCIAEARGGAAPLDARAAALLLEDYLRAHERR
jgi:putative holliday junction resolvase